MTAHHIPFTKMHGLGNDFVVIDATHTPFLLSSAEIQQMANRRYGVGFDQLLVITSCDPTIADFQFRIFNANGTEAEQCGNGARCIALFIKHYGMSTKNNIRLLTLGGVLTLTHQPNGKISVNMGVPRFSPADIPFITTDPQPHHQHYSISVENQPITIDVVNIGNPHAVTLVERIHSVDIEHLGAKISRHEQFPQGVNVGFMQVIDAQNIRLQVYERGTGKTLACGSGACAAVAIGRRNGLLQERVMVSQPGGSLWIDWPGPNTPIIMMGPATLVFTGSWTPP